MPLVSHLPAVKRIEVFAFGENDETRAFLTNPRAPAAGEIEAAACNFRCAKCRSVRLMDFLWVGGSRPDQSGFGRIWASPGTGVLTCRQCFRNHALLLEWDTSAVSVLTRAVVSIATPRTPPPVTYYLDEVARCRGAGASSAAAAMARAALEHLLLDQGFVGMLGQQIKRLTTEIATASFSKAWMKQVDAEMLALLKEIGNGSIHANGGDIKLQEQIDDRLLNDVELVVEGLLQLVYERPEEDRALKERMKLAAEPFIAARK